MTLLAETNETSFAPDALAFNAFILSLSMRKYQLIPACCCFDPKSGATRFERITLQIIANMKQPLDMISDSIFPIASLASLVVHPCPYEAKA